MSSMEKCYALEDSIERCDENQFEGSITSSELKGQAEMWRQVADNENSNVSVVAAAAAASSVSATNVAKKTEKTTEQIPKSLKASPQPPPSPCTRICRYNSKFYNGQVCIGCFRDEYDIRNWDTYDNLSRKTSLEDAGDRCGESDGLSFEGSISCSELYRQAASWSALEDRS